MNPLTIVGGGASWVECPFSTPEIWGAATCLIKEGQKDHHYDKVFAFDNDANIMRAVAEARRRNIPIVSYLGFETELWPSREIVRDTCSSYFLDTVSRMLGYAIFLKYKKIYLYGIDYGPQWQNQQSRSVVTFWLGFAMGRGIDLRLGKGSMRWAYDVGVKPPPEATPIEVPLEDRISEYICESVLS